MIELLEGLFYGIRELGAWGYPLALLVMTGVAILPIPAEIPAMLNGMLFGTAVGIFITWTGGLLGALISFELARHLGRPLVERVLSRDRLTQVDAVAIAAGWPGLLAARLIPVIAFTALNWGAGLTLCRRRTFLWTTALGILPGVTLFVFTGQGLARLYIANPELTVLLILLVALVGWLVVRRRARSARRTGPRDPGQDRA